ncbi:MAG TPA: HEAT repeat domain-containing protein [Actinospica sp.]|jgi:HEAT repeat protein|nr:HEAT repeat domain-containing protein [Actinospica sp.]
MLPREAIQAECGRRGRDEVVAGCVALLRAQPVGDAFVLALGGAHGALVLDSGTESQYWLRVWGARGLLWAWDDVALPALLDALGDEHWRVREMAAKVVARNRVGAAFEAVESLRTDPVSRVARAAQRAVAALVASGE